MYELSRVRLHSVGPKGARYQDVVLNLRGVGAPVRRPGRDTLFDLEGGSPRRRPSPASVLFAENGNGKSVLIKLIFSVMLPGRRQIVGTNNARTLENFVLADDVAHVVLEWQHTETGEQLVIGKTAAWRGHVVSSDANKLSEAWYSFRPSAQFNLDTLPLQENGRYVSQAGFRDRLSEAHKAEPQLQLVWETGHGQWTDHLENLGLDSKLFDYQRKMNAGEGEAADAFSFKTDEAFVDWLLASVTDESDPRTLAEIVDGYATTLSQRGTLIAERDFVAGALDRLGPLAAAARDADTAVELDLAATQAMTRFAGAVTARHTQECARLGLLEDRLDTAKAADEIADRENRRLNAIVLELRRDLAGFELKQAIDIKAELIGERDEAKSVLAAWAATAIVLRFHEAARKAHAVRLLIGEREAQAAQPLRERDNAAHRLVQGLLGLAEQATRESQQSTIDAAALQTRIDQAATEEREHLTQAAQLRTRAETTQELIDKARADIDRAAGDGLIGAGQSPTAAAEEARAVHAGLIEEIEDGDRNAVALVVERRRVGGLLRAAETAERQLSDAARTAEQRYADAVAVTTSLASEERLAALIGSTTVLLDSDCEPLLDRLGQALDEAGTERDTLRLTDDADTRVLNALDTDGLLPPRSDVTAVRDVLAQSGLATYAGWEYLAQMPDEERAAALAAYPHLVDGVVLNSPSHLDQARSVLSDARLLPRSVVAVGATATFQDLDVAVPSGVAFLVTPNPALYDEELAQAEREQLLAAQTVRRARLGLLVEIIAADQRLRLRLESWRLTYAAGALVRLESERDEAIAAHVAATTESSALRISVDQIVAEEGALAQRLTELRRAEQVARSCADRLTTLADRVAEVPAWTELIREALEHAAQAVLAATAAEKEAARLRQRKEETVRRGDDHARIADACRDEIGQVPGGGSTQQSSTVPPEPVETLRAAYRAAVSAYEKVQVGADLRAELTAMEQTESDARKDVERLPADVQVRSKQLLDTPDGGDGPGRSAATARAQRAVDDLELQVAAAAATVVRLEERYRSFIPQDRSLEPYGRPRDIPHAEELIGRADSDRREATRRFEETRGLVEALEAEQSRTRAEVDKFDNVADSMRDTLLDIVDADTTPFAGTVADARTRRDALVAERRETQQLLLDSRAQVTKAASALHRYAADERFEQVESPVRRQILHVGQDQLPGHASDWEAALRPRLRSLADDLEHIDRHRVQIVARLRGMVEIALKTLRNAEKVSALPPTLGDWAGEKFLHIRFADPDSATLDERLGTVIDDAASASGRGGPANKRDGLSLLLRGVRAVLPKGIRVEILKPDPTVRTERIRIAQVSDIFSGGQLLTAAIILYCTMAALRANERGHARSVHAGVLFLDNPIGRASAGYLLDLQLGVADALGVQLVYTTGLFDINALSIFPLILRLRNDRDLRTGMAYLTVEDEIRNMLTVLGEPDGTGRITSARFFRKPRTTVGVA
jgi:hypothetical protein